MLGDSDLERIIDSEQEVDSYTDKEIVVRMKKLGLFVVDLDDLVPPGYNVNQGEVGVKYCYVDLVYKALALKKMRDKTSSTPVLKSSSKRSANASKASNKGENNTPHV